MPEETSNKRGNGERVMSDLYRRAQDRILLSGSVIILTGFFLTAVPNYSGTLSKEEQAREQDREYLRLAGRALMGLGTVGSIGLMYRNKQRFEKDISDR